MNEREIRRSELRACIQIVREYAKMERAGVGPCNAAVERLMLREMRADADADPVILVNLDDFEAAA